jgi:hypothetical protein
MAGNHARYSIEPSTVQLFATGWLADNGVAVLTVRSGEQLRPAEIIDLAAGARALFSLVTLLCRRTDQIHDCAALWEETLVCYQRAQAAWADIETQDELLKAYLAQLARSIELAQDRRELYNVEGWERKVLLGQKADRLCEESNGDHTQATV